MAAPPRDSRALRHLRCNGAAGRKVGPVERLGEPRAVGNDMVDLGAVLYAMVAVLIERGVDMVFWALEQKRKREKETNDKIRAGLISELLADEIPQTREDLEKWARNRGIPLDESPRR